MTRTRNRRTILLALSVVLLTLIVAPCLSGGNDWDGMDRGGWTVTLTVAAQQTHAVGGGSPVSTPCGE